MKKIVLVAALAAATIAMSGCAALTGFNAALLPELKPIDARIHTDVSCGDMAAQVLGISGGQLSAPAAVGIVQFCERRDATQTLVFDPQGARKALAAAINKVPIAAALPAVAIP